MEFTKNLWGPYSPNFPNAMSHAKKTGEVKPRVSSLLLFFSLAMMRVCLDPNSTARWIRGETLSVVDVSLALGCGNVGEVNSYL